MVDSHSFSLDYKSFQLVYKTTIRVHVTKPVILIHTVSNKGLYIWISYIVSMKKATPQMTCLPSWFILSKQ